MRVLTISFELEDKLLRKIIPVASIILYVFICCSCDSTKDEDYTYTVDSVWWSDGLDGNQDGYYHFKRLNFNLRLAESVTRIVKARVYYKIQQASGYSFYAFSNDFEVQGNGQNNNLFVSIGEPNRELNRGVYDFSLEVYESNNDRLEAVPDSAQSSKLLGQYFEESAGDRSYSLTAWWSEEYDRNENGYWRYAKLNLDIDVDENTAKTVDAIVYYKNSTSADYTEYYTFQNVEILGDNPDTLSCYVGSEYEELSYDQYDFRIEVYESGSSVMVTFLDQENDALKDVAFESEDEDNYYYSIDRVWWSNEIDLDNDTYTRSRIINFNVDVDKNEQREIFAKIYYRHQDSADYAYYDSTDYFTITGVDTSDYYSWLVGTPIQLDSAEYDFMVSIFENIVDSLRVAEASTSGYSDTTLTNKRFENIIQDTP